MSHLIVGSQRMVLPVCTFRVHPSNEPVWSGEVFAREADGSSVMLMTSLQRPDGVPTAESLSGMSVELTCEDSEDGLQVSSLPGITFAPWGEQGRARAQLRARGEELFLEYSGTLQRVDMRPTVELKDCETFVEGTMSLRCELKVESAVPVQRPQISVTAGTNLWWKFW